MKKVIVTGAAGLVGQNLIPMLVKEKYNVIAIDKNKNNLELLKKLNPLVKCLKDDLSKKGKWEEEFKGASIVIQLQAQIASKTEKDFVKNNVNAVKNILRACEKNKVKNLIHISSSVVISVAKDEYTLTKRKGEDLVIKSKTPFTILRPPLIYGCFDAKHLGWITRFMKKSLIVPVIGSGKYIRQPLFVQDLCKIIVKLTKRKPQNKIYNIIGKEKIYYIDLLKTICRTKGWKRIFLPIPIPLFSALINVYGVFTKKPAFRPEQIKALTAGDIFPVEDWEKEFGVKYTCFEKGIHKTLKSACSKYSEKMVTPH